MSGNGFERPRVFRERAVMRDKWHIQAQIKGDGARIAEAATRHKSDANAKLAGFQKRGAVGFRDCAVRVKQRAVKVKSE